MFLEKIIVLDYRKVAHLQKIILVLSLSDVVVAETPTSIVMDMATLRSG